MLKLAVKNALAFSAFLGDLSSYSDNVYIFSKK